MSTFQDASIGLAVESSYKTGVTPTRFYEFTDESLQWNKSIKQGAGLRVGGRVARSGRRVVPSADGSGDFTIEACNKGMGLLWQGALGAGTSTVVSDATYQQVFTLGDTPPSFTIQKGLPQAGGTVDAYTYTGCMVDSWEFDFPNADICSLKTTWDLADVNTSTAYAAPSYPTGVSLYNFSGGTIYTGAVTQATATALATAATPIADVRAGNITGNNNLAKDRFNIGGGGRKAKPTVGLRELGITLTVEYDSTTWRDAVLNDTPMSILLNFTGGSLSTGSETLQVVANCVKFDSPLAQTNGTDLITTDLSGQILDDLTGNPPIAVVMRTSDTAL